MRRPPEGLGRGSEIPEDGPFGGLLWKGWLEELFLVGVWAPDRGGGRGGGSFFMVEKENPEAKCSANRECEVNPNETTRKTKQNKKKNGIPSTSKDKESSKI